MAAVIFNGSYAKVLPSGGILQNVVTKTGTYTASINDDLILCNTNAFTVTLPACSGNSGKTITIKKIGSDGNTITIARAGSDTIEGATSYTLTIQYEDVTLQSDGSSLWYVVGRSKARWG